MRRYVTNVDRMGRRSVPDLLDAWFVMNGHMMDLSDANRVEEAIEQFREVIERVSPDLHIAGIEVGTDEQGETRIEVRSLRNGEERITMLFGQGHYTQGIHRLTEQLQQGLPLPITLAGEQIHSWRALMETTMSSARKGYEIQRYKGLGEMNPEQLWETTMDPQTRTLSQVTVEDMSQADHIFSVLMGDAVDPRKKFIIDHALDVRNLTSKGRSSPI